MAQTKGIRLRENNVNLMKNKEPHDKIEWECVAKRQNREAKEQEKHVKEIRGEDTINTSLRFQWQLKWIQWKIYSIP